MVTTCVVLLATNLYQTSLCVPPVSQPTGRPVLGVAFTMVPDELAQLVAEVNVIAPLQSSLAGGGV